MRRLFFFIFVLLLSHKGFSQRGLYQEDNLFFGSNILKNEFAMSQINLDLGIGYNFSEKFKLGLFLPIGYSFFKDENNNKARSFSSGIGISGNFRFYSNEIIILRSDTRFAFGSPNKESLSDWGFTRIGTEIQTYFSSLASERTKPYIAIGANAIYGLYEKNNIVKERFYFMPHISAGIVTNF